MLSDEERNERLSDLYLTLWQQLALHPAGPSADELRRRAQLLLEDLQGHLPESGTLRAVIAKDVSKTEAFLQAAGAIDGIDRPAYMSYLRDHADRYLFASFQK